MSDRKEQELYYFTHMWDRKQKATHEQTNKLIDIGNSIVVTTREGHRGEVEGQRGSNKW